MECVVSNSLGHQVMSLLGIYAVFPIVKRDYLYRFTHLAGLPRCTHLFLTGIWFASVWIIWKERNDCIFKNAASHPYALLRKLSYILFCGWRQSIHLLVIVIMIGGNIRCSVWVFTNNYLCLFCASLYLSLWLCKSC